MYLICFGTRPELIKLIPLIRNFKENNIEFKTIFSGQHENLIEDFYKYIDQRVGFPVFAVFLIIVNRVPTAGILSKVS